MKIPKKFLIKGNEWRVKRRKKIILDSELCAGLTDVSKREILVDSQLADDRAEWVFWHEYCHAILYECGVTENTGGISDLAEEIICDAFADALTMDKNVKFKRTRKMK